MVTAGCYSSPAFGCHWLQFFRAAVAYRGEENCLGKRLGG